MSYASLSISPFDSVVIFKVYSPAGNVQRYKRETQLAHLVAIDFSSIYKTKAKEKKQNKTSERERERERKNFLFNAQTSSSIRKKELWQGRQL